MNEAGPSRDADQALSAAEIANVLEVSEQTVLRWERDGLLFAILRSGRQRGPEFPAFQTWPGVVGDPLKRTLAALVPPGNTGPVSGPVAYGFLTSPTYLLAGLAPVEVLVGRMLGPRILEVRAGEVLERPAESRLQLVLKTARTIAMSDGI